MRHSLILIVLVTLAVEPASVLGCEAPCSSARAVREGHWLEARGRLADGGRFVADDAELLSPGRYETLIGTLQKGRRRGEFRLLGLVVVPGRDVKWRGVGPVTAVGRRVKVEGHYQGDGRFLARTISTRGEGRERIGGRVDAVRRSERGTEAQVMGYIVELPATVSHDQPLAELRPAPSAAPAASAGVDEDDLFGRGLRLGRDLRLTGQVEIEVAGEDEFDLDRREEEDRVDLEGSARLRLEWTPTARVGAVLETRQSGLWRQDDEDGRVTRDNGRLGQTYVLVRDVAGPGVDLQLGRQDFDDRREWIYDQDLDAIRLVASRERWRLELSASTSLADGSPRDRDATNYVAHLSRRFRNNGSLAAYAVRREIGGPFGDRTNHVGVSAIGEWLPGAETWLEAAVLSGFLGGRDALAWGFDFGTTWSPRFLDPMSLTVGYAFGSGDRSPEGTDGTFRQTGLQDNNGKFAGVTSFRYYGELVDPELANLSIATAGIGMRLGRRTSLDLVWHGYRQAEAVPFLVDAELDRRPDGVDTDLGWEVDLVLGSRRWASYDLEAVAAWFEPGSAFPDDSDPAALGRLQLRYRF